MRLWHERIWLVGGALLVALTSAAALGCLLTTFPYNGLYGVDSYAYAGQSLALLRELAGLPPEPGALFAAEGLPHWPIGYHAHLMLGRLITPGGIEGGRLITLVLASAVPVLAYLLGVRLAGFLARPARIAAGLVAAWGMLLAATFTRMGTSLMSDVPAMLWALLTCVVVVWGWPPHGELRPPGSSTLWAVAAGGALGMAVFVRYASVLLVVPLTLYLFLRHRAASGGPLRLTVRASLHLRPVITALVAFGSVLLPLAIYLLTHEAGPESGTYFASMSAGNLLSRSSSGPDGPAVFPHTMLEFYVLGPLWDVLGGFLPAAFLALVIAGLLVLVVRKQWAGLGLLVTWWLLPALAYALTPYQTHRYALLYLPAITTLAGFGAAAGVEGLTLALRRRHVPRALGSALLLGFAALLLAWGVPQGRQSVRDWQVAHEAWQAGDMALARDAVAVAGADGRMICFTSCAPLDFYADLPQLDMYGNDEEALAAFVRPGQTVVVVPERSMETQWEGEEVGDRWRWLKTTYQLDAAITSGEFTIFRVAGP